MFDEKAVRDVPRRDDNSPNKVQNVRGTAWFTVATRNRSDFEKAGVKVVDPFQTPNNKNRSPEPASSGPCAWE
jgi:hypothetical protein